MDHEYKNMSHVTVNVEISVHPFHMTHIDLQPYEGMIVDYN